MGDVCYETCRNKLMVKYNIYRTVRLLVLTEFAINSQCTPYLLHGAESLWEANRFSASQEIPRILWNPKVHYHIHKCPPPVPVLSQLYPVYTPTSHFLEIQLNIFLPSTPGSPKWSPSPSGFPTKTLYKPLFFPIRAICRAHLILLDFTTRTLLVKEYRLLSSS